MDQTALKLIIHQRLQGFICLETVLDIYIQDDPEQFADIVKVEPPFWEKPYYLMLSRHFKGRHPERAEKIWNAIREIKQSDKYRNLVKKYISRR